MLRVTIALLVVVTACGTAESADRALPRHSWRHGWHRTTVILPAGLPRRHYHYRTTISYGYQQPVPRLSVYENPADLYAPDYTDVAYIRPSISPPVLPGYYGASYTHEYQGPYYGGPYVPYGDHLPYACSVYGYC